MDKEKKRFHTPNRLNLTGKFLVLVLAVTTLSCPHGVVVDGRPTKSSTEDGDIVEAAGFDSQRQRQDDENDPPRTMIVRVIVSSSSSSSSSSSTSSQENGNPDYGDATFTDYEFPVNPDPQPTSPRSTKRPLTTTTTTTTEASTTLSSPSSSPKMDVEDIFSAFYKAFSQSPGGGHHHSPVSDASHNVERFQFFYPNGENTNTPSPSPFRTSFGKGETSGISHFGGISSNNNPTPKEDDDSLSSVVSTSSSSTSSSSSGVRDKIIKWTPPPPDERIAEKVVAVSTSTSSRQYPISTNNKFQNSPSPSSSPNFRANYFTTSTTTTTTEPGISFRTTRRRQRQRQRFRNPKPEEQVRVSVSSSTSTTDDDHQDNDPRALPLVQYQEPSTTTTTTTTTTTPKPWQPQVWGEPEKVWGQPAQVWGEPAKVWGEPAKVWGLPEQNWGHPPPPPRPRPPTTTTTTTTSRSTRSFSSSSKFSPKRRRIPIRDEDYPRDAEAADVEEEPSGGSFVILGEEDPDQDSIDGSFDHHLGLPPVSPRPISLDQFKTFNFSYHHTFKNHLNLTGLSGPSSSVSRSSNPTPSFSSTISSSSSSTSLPSDSSTSGESEPIPGTKFGYVLEGSNVRRYRVEERTPDGFVVGEYGVLNNQNAFLRGVRYTADGTISPRLVHEALMKFLALRRRR